MKKRIEKLLNEFGLVLESYKPFRSDNGAQCFMLSATLNGTEKTFKDDDGYFIGSGEVGRVDYLNTLRISIELQGFALKN